MYISVLEISNSLDPSDREQNLIQVKRKNKFNSEFNYIFQV